MVTMQQVADRAHVSITTVSFVVNDTKPVSPGTRSRVLRAIDELGYRRNAVARALASRKSHIIALIYPLLDTRNHHAFIDGAASVCAKRGYSLVLWPIHSENANAEIASLTQVGFADGVLLMEVQLDDERVTHLKETKSPFALIGRTRDLVGIDYVDMDFEHTVQTAVRDLVALGHRDIVLIVEDHRGTALAGYGPPLRAEETFQAVVPAAGIRGHVVRLPPHSKAVFNIAGTVMREAPQATAILSMHDEATMALVNGLRRRGVRIPQDMSIAGVATASTIPALMEPPLTTYRAPGADLGGKAAAMLIDRLEGYDGPPTQSLIVCPLQDGSSVGPAPEGRAPWPPDA